MEHVHGSAASLDMVASFAERGLFALSEYSRCREGGGEPLAEVDAQSICTFGEQLEQFLASDPAPSAAQRASGPHLAGMAYFHGVTVPRLVFVGRAQFADSARAAQVLCDAGRHLSFYFAKKQVPTGQDDQTLEEAKRLCVEFLRNTKLAA